MLDLSLLPKYLQEKNKDITTIIGNYTLGKHFTSKIRLLYIHVLKGKKQQYFLESFNFGKKLIK